MTRAFISIELPGEVRKEIIGIQKEIDKLNMIKGKFTEKDNLHLTLKFLGEIDDDKLAAVKKKLKDLKFDKFEVELDKLGVFNENFIKIIWISLSGQELWDLQRKVDEVLKDEFRKEDRFMGHITIARPKFVRDRKEFIEKLKNIEFDKKKFFIDKVFLKKSELKSSGPEYSDLMVVESS